MIDDVKEFIMCCMISLALVIVIFSIRIEVSIKNLETKIDKYHVTEEEQR